MQVIFGVDAREYQKTKERVPVVWDSRTMVNGHMLLVGMSGAGKTHTLRRIVHEMQATAAHKLRVHVFDVHGDIEIDGASTVKFSEQTDYGLNPLIVDPDPHFGGVRKRIEGLIATLKKTDGQLGGKQAATLRNLLTDLYESFGFKANDPRTWTVDHNEIQVEVEDGRIYLDVRIEEKDEAKQFGAKWDTDRRCWWVAADAYEGPITKWQPKVAGRRHPTMNDALRFTRRMLKNVFFGINQPGIEALEAFCRVNRTYASKVLAAQRRGDKAFDDEDLLKDREKAGEKAKTAFAKFIDESKTGREVDDLIKYDSFDVMKSSVDRLENLNAIGIFKNKLPPFDPDCPVWRYHLTALSMVERKLFVLFRLQEIFMAAVQRGEQADIVEVVILDEAHIYADDDENNIINTMAKEARKFGVSLICASQSPTHFTDDFVSSVATKVILGIDETYWDGAVRKLKLEPTLLPWIKPTMTMAVQVKQRGEARNVWNWVLIPRQAPVPAREQQAA